MRATSLLRLLSVPLALVRLARVLLRARPEPPQCVLVLGGCKERELEAARMFGAAAVPSARMLLLSSGAASLSELQAAAAPAAAHTVLVDRRAVDTVTNFTTVARSLAAAGVTSVACATAREHCSRALAVGTLVLGAEGESLCGSNAACLLSTVVPVRPRACVATTGLEASALPVESHEALAEGWLRTLRDVGRALLWLLSGLHGGSLNLIFHPRRVADARARGEWWASGAEATRREALVVERFRAALAE